MFAAIFNGDRRPVDLVALGLSAEDCRILGAARHVALLRSSEKFAVRDRETSVIRSLGNGLWMVGRLRLDGRGDLAGQLGAEAALEDDALLCLRAYARWGDAFLDRIAGDFCFVLWDESRGRLLAARDQLGVRSLFHAQAGGTWVVGDSLDWIAGCRSVEKDLDDIWIADCLSADRSLEFERTVYRDVRRLPPAHLLTFFESGSESRRYWRLAIDEPLYLGERRLYGERFRELTQRAIADRLSDGRVGISISGGLDSTTLAACAIDVLRDPARVVARTFRFDRLMPDNEIFYSREAARHLGIELSEVATDDLAYDPNWRDDAAQTAEPDAGIVHGGGNRRLNAQMADAAPVWLYGEGPDNALKFERGAYLSWLRRQRRWGRLLEAGLLYAHAKGWHGWGLTWRRYLRPQPPNPPANDELPPWLSADLVHRLDLRGRLERLSAHDAPSHPWHPRAIASFAEPIWQALFADCDSDEAQANFVWRHPFLDLRVLQFMLSLPPLPWARRKLVMREAMRGRLPAVILARDKTPLAANPETRALESVVLPPLLAPDAMKRWVDLDRVAAERVGGNKRSLLPVLALDFWLANRRM